MKTLSNRVLANTTLGRQFLLNERAAKIEDALRAHPAVQAQEPASVYLSLCNRVEGLTLEDLQDYIQSEKLLKLHLLRVTLHVAPAEDFSWMHRSIESLYAKLHRYSFETMESLGISREQAFTFLPSIRRKLSTPHTKEEALLWLAKKLSPPQASAIFSWSAAQLPLAVAPGSERYSYGGEKHYFAPKRPRQISEEKAIERLIASYLRGYGPASISDIAQYSGLTKGKIKEVLAGMKKITHYAREEGEVLLDIQGMQLVEESAPARTVLLGMFDNLLLGFADRSRFMRDSVRKNITQVNGDLLPTVLVGGKLAGVWKLKEGRFTFSALEEVTKEGLLSIEEEARRLSRQLSLKGESLYPRSLHWWEKRGFEETFSIEL